MAGARRPQPVTPLPADTGAFAAEVVEVQASGLLQVRRRVGPSALVACRSALPGYGPQIGDRVVVIALAVEGLAGDSTPGACIIGVLDAPPRERMTTPSGASAERAGEALVLRDPSGALVASYEPGAATLRIGSALGEGKLLLDAREIELRAGVRATLSAPELEVTTRSASLHSDEASIAAASVRVVAEELAQAVGRWELRATRLIERAGEAYREAELAETRADRVRTFARAAYEVVAGRASILADDDAVIDGKRVLLG